ncbi:FAD-dependent oxidoreductase [Actinopolymorpha sp. B17G11]|uniref:FAD-dependent oxidoreductase n=1 Tax=Actinopolymorpha sp. B17G11 TaxID=3160861 RepID=UPI0032E4083D
MRLVVDLTRCQGYAQCAFLAPDVFSMRGNESLTYDAEPDDRQRDRILRAAAACPVQAILLDRLDGGAAPGGTAAVPTRARSTSTRPRVERIVIVGASLAGLRAAVTLRAEGFTGTLTVIGDERHAPYDRPPLSKHVLTGRVPAQRTSLPRTEGIDARWMLGSPAARLDIGAKEVVLADGRRVGYDRVLIATGVRARPWPNPTEAALDGVFVLRTRDDATVLRRRLGAEPRRVLVIGAGFTGSEIASDCCDLGIPVTVAERGPTPLVGALGGVIGATAARMQRKHGVDLRCGVTVTALEGDADGRLRRAKLSDGSVLDVDVAVAALGAIRNVEWLHDSGLAAGAWGVACDAGCRAFDVNGLVTDDVFVAGDVARFPHPIYDYQLLALEHWGNAVTQAEVAAHNMLSAETERWPHLSLPVFWSTQFGIEIKSVGVPTYADELVITQGALDGDGFVAAYGYQGRITAAVCFDQAKWLDFYARLIERRAAFPPDFHAVDQPDTLAPVSAEIPDQTLPSHVATVLVTGHQPSDRRATLVHGGEPSGGL